MGYPIHGKDAYIDKGGTKVALSNGWEISVEVPMESIASQGDDWETAIPGCAKWSGSMDLTLDPTNTEQKALIDNIVAAAPGAALTDLKFYLDTGDYYDGDIRINQLSITANTGGKVTGKLSFMGDGALSLTVA